jgi:hypothetical protein
MHARTIHLDLWAGNTGHLTQSPKHHRLLSTALINHVPHANATGRDFIFRFTLVKLFYCHPTSFLPHIPEWL